MITPAITRYQKARRGLGLVAGHGVGAFKTDSLPLCCFRRISNAEVRFLSEVNRIRYELRGVNFQLSHQCLPDAVLILIVWQDYRLKKHTEIIASIRPANFFDVKAKFFTLT